ncbi:MAG: hypothetical protein PHH49_07950, partial [Candidatus Omnitrophica bacterium]|nr:hypothetical protein [Candidatus Omnitrophota bacterium]MDD5488870.1 hypothetical protein [Candidatus Omnitrophota bacterium]
TVDRRTRPDSSVTRKAESTLGELGAKGVTRDQVNGAVSEYSRLRATGNERSAVASWSGFLMQALSSNSTQTPTNMAPETGARMQNILSGIEAVNSNALNDSLDTFDSIAAEDNYDRQLGMLMAMSPETGLNESRKISGWMNTQAEIGRETGKGFSVRMSLSQARNLSNSTNPMAGNAHIAEEIRRQMDAGDQDLAKYASLADTVLDLNGKFENVLRQSGDLQGTGAANRMLNNASIELKEHMNKALDDLDTIKGSTGLSEDIVASMLTGTPLDKANFDNVRAFSDQMAQNDITRLSGEMSAGEKVKTSLDMPLNSNENDTVGLDLISTLINSLGLSGKLTQNDIARIHYNQSRIIDEVINNSNGKFAGNRDLLTTAMKLRELLSKRSGKLSRNEIRTFSESQGTDIDKVYDLMGLNSVPLREAYHNIAEREARHEQRQEDRSRTEASYNENISDADLNYAGNLIDSFSDMDSDLGRIKDALSRDLGKIHAVNTARDTGRTAKPGSTNKSSGERRGATDIVVTSAMVASMAVALSGTGMIGVSLPVAIAFGAVVMAIPLVLSLTGTSDAVSDGGTTGHKAPGTTSDSEMAKPVSETFEMDIDGTNVMVDVSPSSIRINFARTAEGPKKTITIGTRGKLDTENRDRIESIVRRSAPLSMRTEKTTRTDMGHVMATVEAVIGEIGLDNFNSFETSFEDIELKVSAMNNGTFATELTHNPTGSRVSVNTAEPDVISKARTTLSEMDRIPQRGAGVSEFNDKIAPTLSDIRSHIVNMTLNFENSSLTISSDNLSSDTAGELVTITRYGSRSNINKVMRSPLSENNTVPSEVEHLMAPGMDVRTYEDMESFYRSTLKDLAHGSGNLSVYLGTVRIELDMTNDTLCIANTTTSKTTDVQTIEEAFAGNGIISKQIEAERSLGEARTEIYNGNLPEGHTVIVEDRQGNKYEFTRKTGSKGLDITKNGKELARSRTYNLIDNLSQVAEGTELKFMVSVIDTELNGRLPIEQRWMVMADGEVKISDKSSISFGKTGIKFGSSMIRRRGDTSKILYESHTHPDSAMPNEYTQHLRADLAERLIVAAYENINTDDVAPMEVNELDSAGNVIGRLAVSFMDGKGLVSVYSTEGILLGKEVILNHAETLSMRAELERKYDEMLASRQKDGRNVVIEDENGENFVIARMNDNDDIELAAEHVLTMVPRDGQSAEIPENVSDRLAGTSPAQPETLPYGTHTDDQGTPASEATTQLSGPIMTLLNAFDVPNEKTLIKALRGVKAQDIAVRSMGQFEDTGEAVESLDAVRKTIENSKDNSTGVTREDAENILVQIRKATDILSRMGASIVATHTGSMVAPGDRTILSKTTGTDDLELEALNLTQENDSAPLDNIEILSYSDAGAKASELSISGTDEFGTPDKHSLLVISASVLEDDMRGLESLARDIFARNALKNGGKQRILIVGDISEKAMNTITGWGDIADIITAVGEEALPGEIADIKRIDPSVKVVVTGVFTGNESFFEAVASECDSYIIAGEDFTFGMALALALTRAHYVAFAGITDEGVNRLREIAKREKEARTGRQMIRLESAGSTAADEAIDEALFADLKADTAF